MANEYIRKEWSGGVIRSTLNGSINAAATAITLTDGSSFPSGVKPFVLVIDRGQSTEEKIICTSRTGNNLTVLARGYDGSTAQSHSSGAYVEHSLDAYTVDQANALATTMTTQGDIIYKTVTGDNTSYGRLGIGTTGYPVVSAGTAPAYQQLGTTGIAATAVTAAKVNADVAGTALVKNGTTGALDVKADETTIEVVTASDWIRVKDLGITNAKIAVGTIDLTKLASGTSGYLIVCNSSGVPTFVAMTGDVTMGPLGITTIGAGTVTKTKLATTTGELGGSWTAFIHTSTRNADSNVSSVSINGGYQLVGKSCRFRMNVTATAVSAGACVIGLPTVIGTTISEVQPVSGLVNTAGLNKTVASARIDPSAGARVQFWADAAGTNWTASQAIVLNVTGTFEVA